MDFLKPTCLMEWGYVESFYLQMAFPFMMASFAFIKWLYMKFSNIYFFKNRCAPLFVGIQTKRITKRLSERLFRE